MRSAVSESMSPPSSHEARTVRCGCTLPVTVTLALLDPRVPCSRRKRLLGHLPAGTTEIHTRSNGERHLKYCVYVFCYFSHRTHEGKVARRHTGHLPVCPW